MDGLIRNGVKLGAEVGNIGSTGSAYEGGEKLGVLSGKTSKAGQPRKGKQDNWLM